MFKYYLAGMIVSSSLFGSAQILNEDFSTASGTTPPAGWTTTDLSSSGVNWKFDDNSVWGFDPNITDMFALLDSYDDGTGTPEDAVLVSPAFDASALAGSLILEFDHEFYQLSASTWAVDVFDGTSWTQVAGGNTDVYPTEHVTLDITAASGNSSVAQIRFHWTGQQDFVWGLDNVLLADVTCPHVTDILLGTITYNSADISWTAGASETNWIVEYGPTGFTPGTGTVVNVSGTPSTTLSPLLDNTTYDVYVSSDCGSGDVGISQMSTFTTICYLPAITAYPWTEDFESATLYELPCGWQQLDLNNDGIVWQVTDLMPASGSNSLDITYNSSEAMDDWAYTPAFTMTAGTTYLLQFKYAAYDNTYPESFEVVASSAQDPGSTLTTLGTFMNITNTTFQTFIQTFTPSTSGDYYFGFHGMSDADEYDILIDDIVVDLAPSCLPVTNLGTAVISSTSVELTWDAVASETNWVIEYGPAGFTPGTGTLVNVSSTDETVNGLSFLTSYDFYVFADCGSGDYSDTVALTGVMTLCGVPPITAFPWMEDFESTNLDELPCGWLETDNNADDIIWGTTDYNAQSGTNAMGISYNSSMDMDDWAFTPGFSLSAGIPYRFIYSYAVSSSSYAENFSVSVGNAQSGSAMSAQLADYPNIINDTFITDTVMFTPSTAGTYYFGFHGYSIADQDMILIDDVQLEETCVPESAAFSYSNDTLCINSGIATPTISGTTGGVFSSNGLNINPTTGSFNPATTPTGAYTVTYVSGFTDCSDTMTLTLVISNCGLGINENALGNISVYPNPASSLVHITVNADTQIQGYQVLDMSGKIIAHSTKNEGSDAVLDLSGAASGLYMVNVITDKGAGTVRVSVSK